MENAENIEEAEKKKKILKSIEGILKSKYVTNKV